MEQKPKYSTGIIDIPIGNMIFTIYSRGVEWNEDLEPKDISSGEHFHVLFEFQYVMDKQLKLKTQRNTYTAVCGEYILIPPNCYHHTIYREESFKRYSFLFSIHMQENNAKVFSEFAYYFNILKQVESIVINNNVVVSDCIRRIVELDKAQKDIHEKIHKIKILFGMLFLAFTEDIDHNQQEYTGLYREFTPQKIKLQNDITEYILNHYDSNTLLKDLEKEFHMSTRHINRIFNELFGMSVSVMVLDIRMHSAWKYIEENEFTLEKIASLIGYNSYNTFYRAFRKYYGFSPEMLKTNMK